MQFQEHDSTYAVPTYHETHFAIDNRIFRQPICVNRENITQIAASNYQDLAPSDFQAALDDKADLIIIGTGKQQKFIDLTITAQLSMKGVGIECMNSSAACRTLLLLQNERRNVWAWLFL